MSWTQASEEELWKEFVGGIVQWICRGLQWEWLGEYRFGWVRNQIQLWWEGSGQGAQGCAQEQHFCCWRGQHCVLWVFPSFLLCPVILNPSCFCLMEDAALFGRLWKSQQPHSCIREMNFSPFGFGNVCVSLDPPQTVQMDQWWRMWEQQHVQHKQLCQKKQKLNFQQLQLLWGLETGSLGSSSEEIPLVPIWLGSFETPRHACLLKLHL